MSRKLNCFLIASLAAGSAFAQDSGLAAINAWMTQQVTAAAQAQKTQAQTTTAKKKPAQSQSISVDHGSTTFVDQSSGSDLVSAALNLLPVGGTSGGSGTVSASAYALYALGTQQDPLQPSFYNSHENWRKMFFTVGHENQDQNSVNQSAPGTVYGFQWLPWNRRDASSISKDATATAELNKIAADLAGAVSAGTSVIATILTAHNGTPSGAGRDAYLQTLTSVAVVQMEVDKLGSADRALVDQAIKRFSSDTATVDSAISAAVAALQKRTQVSLAFQTIQRKPGLNDDYHLAFILDKGLTHGIFFTFNGTYDYSNSEKVGGDVRDGRAALDFRWNIASPPGSSQKSALQLALSGEGLRKETAWQYRAQLQLQIPIATGINLPVSFGYGNNPDLLSQQEKNIYGKFGITFEPGKIVDALRQSK